MKNRNLSFDGLRGFSILFVVLYHYFYSYHIAEKHGSINIVCQELFKYGSLGVQLFFIISGFVIAFTLTRYQDIFSFAIARISRLYPAYWCSMLLLVLLTYFGAPSHNIYLYIKSITMLPHLMGDGHLVGVYWTLEYEIIFYVIAGTLFQTSLFYRHAPFFVWLCFSLLWRYGLNNIGFVSQHPSLSIFISLCVTHAPLFIFGIYLYKLQVNGWNKYIAFLLLFSSAVYLITFQTSEYQYYINMARLWLVALFSLGLYGVVVPASRILTNKYLCFCGKISYSWYLTHFTFGYLLIGVSEKYFGSFTSVILAFCCSGVIAYLFYLLLENPLQILLAKILFTLRRILFERNLVYSGAQK